MHQVNLMKMCKSLLLLLQLLWVSTCLAADYELILEDTNVFSPCTEGPPGSLNVNEAFDFSEFTFVQESDVIHVSGNATCTWDIQPTDRIAASVTFFHHERGHWEPTLIATSASDFCKVMYDKDQYWFKYWSSHIKNRKDVESKCINNVGTKLMFEPYDAHLILYNFRGPALQGRYKMVVSMEAFDERNLKRAKSACFEIRGDIEKIKH